MVGFIQNSKKKILLICLFINPFLIFLNQNINRFNLNKFIIFSEIIFFFSLLFFFFTLILFFLFKKKISFNSLLFTILLINFFCFFHHDLKMIIPGEKYSSELALIIIVSVLVIFIFKINKKSIYNNILHIFILLNFFYYFLSIIIQSPSIFQTKIIDSEIKYEIKNSKNNKNIYFIINDEATSLELFEKYFNVKIKSKFIDKLKKYNFKYVKNSKSSYNQTELTFTSIFYLDYFLDEKSNKYKNTQNFYPQILRTNFNDMPLIKLLNSINYDFYFVGNTRGSCETYIKKNCIVKRKKFSNLFNEHKVILEVFLLKSPYIPIYNKISEKIRRILKIPLYTNNFDENDAIEKFTKNIDTKNYPKNAFFLIHNLYPHAPYIYNKDCSKKKIRKEIISTINTHKADTGKGYLDNYICSLNKTIKFIDFLDKHDKDAIVIFQGDHGHYFKKNNKTEKLEIFNIIKESNTCSNSISNKIDTVNAIRYLIDCATNIKINLLEQKSFWGPYSQKEKGWGKLLRIK